MSLVVYYESRAIWSPALRVGHLFADELHALERLVDVGSGFVVDDADEVHIDGPQFAAFVNALLDTLERTNHSWLIALITGPLQIAIALLHEMTGTWPDTSERTARILGPMGKLLAQDLIESESTDAPK